MTSLLTAVKLDNLRTFTAQALRQASGDMAEVGVYRGGSARAMLQTMESLQQYRAMHLFDTFSGLPEPGPRDAPGKGHAGQFAASLLQVMEYLDKWALLTRFYVGLFPDSAAELGGVFFSIVHVDVDLEESMKACCKWFPPRMSRGGIMVFDDYASDIWQGVKPVVDAHFGDRVQRVDDCCQAAVRF